ncbi:outer membrane protein OmpA-like peptidoglycan-associated protein [Chitinophaga niastensis]|uniref:Outer membrane protein OmpA-like peptidoglycan-associated protein n=1 Tax=Chitinophaga niastensis TaxID=536980 RepID=A0A2P8HKI3_CHINA|nr:OmpA family protein [Chitinophaga niastensis]PSL46734.1 outer membrane protein OmpA-like peptidoglycan-associated protein [Chitinophaga niastensis]
MRKFNFKYLILFLSIVSLFVSCGFIKDHVQIGGLGSMAKVKRAERLYKRQEYDRAIALCTEVINNGSAEDVSRRAKLQLARIYFETRQFEKTISLYDELLYKPAKDVLVTDVTNYIDLLKRTGRVIRAKEISEVYANNYKNNARFSNLQESLKDYYTFFNRDSMENIKVDSLRLNLPGYQYGLALYRNDVVFLSNDIKKNEAQSFYTNSKLYMISEDGVEPFSSSLRGVLQVGPASFFDNGQRVIYTSNRFTDVKNEKNSYINYNNGTQLLFAIYQPDHDQWSKPVPVKLGKNADSYSFLHPSVAPNGKRLYFASDMPGGQGGTDIYYSDWDKEEKRWKTPVNMGPEVNTNGNELYPFVVGDKLFFSSNGLRGFGGLDIYMINIKDPKEGIVHLPYPVNTQFDDLNPVLDENRQLLYFTSDRSGAHDNDHIYVLNLKKNPLKQLDLPNGKPVKDDDKVPYTMNQADSRQQLTLIGSKQYDNLPVEKKVDSAVLMPVKEVAVAVSPERKIVEYSNDTPNSSPEMIPWQTSTPSNTAMAAPAVANSMAVPAFASQAANSHPQEMSWQQGVSNGNAPSVKYIGQPDNSITYTQQHDSTRKATGKLWRVPGAIYYDLNSYVPQDQEWRKLDSIFQLWKANPHRIIIVSGHTDTIGTEKYNLALSKNRAVYIQECLLSRGVDADKIRINYFGSTRPVLVANQHNLESDRDMFIQLQGVNRRCEIKIL